ncbi:hypothetical protein PDIG_51140 [Penicillium digitatum PHI26]|uniref:HNH nuclease domain-containing protein n=3 Tax=Penicillium digitatum TaxID=36651 RepID=K9G8U7_PEND2|nr:hypothetical protein PDIP_20360 [Penicillium digitatum Pd1]EKV11278.1 hypothetical protein PDIG_51140 [Penicillium digitatum PHI26]EKV20053.1 hypothetical protein PDIP_20360 [Penicillium digitatum Pd1]
MESLQPETEAIHILKKRKHDLTNDLQTARRLWRAHGSFDLKFWAQAVKIEKINLERSDVDRKVSLGSFDGVEETWKRTDEAKTILEQIEAQKQTKKICEERVHQLQSAPPRRSMRACFMKFFTTSTMGMAIKGTGAGARDTSQQSNFRAAMIETYKAKHPTEPWLWCPILGDYTDDDDIQASHLFPCRNGQDCLDAIFGKTRAEELFSPRNGLLLCKKLERYFDSGKFVIVPDIPNFQKNVLVSAVKGWLNCEPRQYRVKLIDPDWEKKDEKISRWQSLTFGQLDGRPLRFRSNFRPAARYLYFHYCIQILRMCWQHSSQGRSSQAAALLQLEKGNPFWGTVGRYLPRNMLLALVEEMGHEYTFVLDGAAASRPADDKLLLGLASRHVKERPSILTPGVYDPADSEEEFSWLEEDSEDE